MSSTGSITRNFFDVDLHKENSPQKIYNMNLSKNELLLCIKSLSINHIETNNFSERKIMNEQGLSILIMDTIIYICEKCNVLQYISDDEITNITIECIPQVLKILHKKKIIDDIKFKNMRCILNILDM